MGKQHVFSPDKADLETEFASLRNFGLPDEARTLATPDEAADLRVCDLEGDRAALSLLQGESIGTVAVVQSEEVDYCEGSDGSRNRIRND